MRMRSLPETCSLHVESLCQLTVPWARTVAYARHERRTELEKGERRKERRSESVIQSVVVERKGPTRRRRHHNKHLLSTNSEN
eukprot:scaffold50643_cov27-Attheya_sp.AAC.1